MTMSDQAMLSVLQRLLDQPREQATLEFKSNWDLADDIGEYVSALSNAAALNGHDRAWMVWGVDDATKVIKSTTFDPFTQKVKTDKPGSNQQLIMWLQFMTQPSPRAQCACCIQAGALHPH
jgi:ATP-dependent DNA helicase RecG